MLLAQKIVNLCMVRLSQFILQNPFLLLFALMKRYTREQLDSRYPKKASKLHPFGSLFYFSIFLEYIAIAHCNSEVQHSVTKLLRKQQVCLVLKTPCSHCSSPLLQYTMFSSASLNQQLFPKVLLHDLSMLYSNKRGTEMQVESYNQTPYWLS